MRNLKIFIVFCFLGICSSAQVPTNGLVAYFPFNGNANDESGNGNNATAYGASLSADRFGNANASYSLNGVSDYLETNSNFSSILGAKSRSVSLWLKTSKIGRQSAIVWGTQVGCYGKFNVGVSNASNSSVSIITGCDVIDQPATVLDGKWHHLVCVFDSAINKTIAAVKFYLDGNLVVFNPGTSFTASLNTQIDKIVFGKDGNNDRFQGSIDDIRIYNRALNQQEITELYKNPCDIPPVATITPQSAVIFCKGGSVILTASASSSYLWSTGATTQSITVTTSGLFTVKVTDGNGCSATSSAITVTENPLPSATITPVGSTTFCQGGSVKLDASTGSGYIYQWFKNNIQLVNETNRSYTATESGNYSVKVTAGDCSRISEQLLVTVNPFPNIKINQSGPTIFCTGDSINLSVSPVSNTTYLWNTGERTNFLHVTQSGNYSVTVTSNGCSATSQLVNVTVKPIPVASITASGSTTFCEGGSVFLTGNGGDTYLWNNGSTQRSIQVATAGIYSVKVTSNECTSIASQSVIVNQKPAVSLNPLSNFINVNSTSINLSGNPSGGVFGGEGVSGNIFDPKNAGLGKTILTYSFTNIAGCSNSASQNIVVYDTTGVYCSTYDTLIINAVLTGVFPISTINIIKVYPNPAKTHLNISFSDYAVQNGFTVQIKNSLGQTVFSSSGNQQLFNINLSSWSGKGLYMVHVINKQGITVDIKKVVIQ